MILIFLTKVTNLSLFLPDKYSNLMALNTPLINELKAEAISTRKMLSRVPFDKKDWAPHEKSTTIFNLARHVARIPEWINRALEYDEVDAATKQWPPYPELNSAEELTAYFDGIIKNAEEALQAATDEDLKKNFVFRRGDFIIFSMPKDEMITRMAFNHHIHHRGQLSVYLRLLDIPVPGMYGPSADEQRPAA